MNPTVKFNSASTKNEKHTLHSNRKKLCRLHVFLAVHLIFLAFLLLNAIHAGAQNPSNKKDNRPRNLMVDTSSVIEERLVKLALEGPLFKGSDHQNKINEYQLQRAKNSWLNLLTVSTNYNDQSFAKNPTTSYVYPKYFFGLNIPLGTIFSKTEVKSAKEQVELSKDNQDQLARNIRADVISKYKQYKTYNDLIAIQSQVVDDQQAAFQQIEKKFLDRTIEIDKYNVASRDYNEERAKKLNLQLEQDLIKVEIERMIGTKLENVINN
jgi:Outer membrane efflux protein